MSKKWRTSATTTLRPLKVLVQRNIVFKHLLAAIKNLLGLVINVDMVEFPLPKVQVESSVMGSLLLG